MNPAHPRRCGENPMGECRYGALYGSSPQVRGKPGRQVSARYTSRLIPAGAGKTVYGDARVSGDAAHPRRCGENHRRVIGGRHSPGSSPQVRGKLRDLRRGSKRRRLIPAGAGKTTFLRKPSNHPAAHPRRCGENDKLGWVHEAFSGSSPQVRGKRCCRRNVLTSL